MEASESLEFHGPTVHEAPDNAHSAQTEAVHEGFCPNCSRAIMWKKKWYGSKKILHDLCPVCSYKKTGKVKMNHDKEEEITVEGLKSGTDPAQIQESVNCVGGTGNKVGNQVIGNLTQQVSITFADSGHEVVPPPPEPSNKSIDAEPCPGRWNFVQGSNNKVGSQVIGDINAPMTIAL